jgi:hypothetical protein
METKTSLPALVRPILGSWIVLAAGGIVLNGVLFGAILVAVYRWIFEPPPGSPSVIILFAVCMLAIGGVVAYVVTRHVNRNCYWMLTAETIVGRKDESLIVNLDDVSEISFATVRQETFRGWQVRAADRHAFNVVLIKMRDGRTLPLSFGGKLSGAVNFMKGLLVSREALLRDNTALSKNAQEYLRPIRFNDFCVIP